jgi:ABC-type phosphate transport system substrate-binding protein
VCKHIFALLLCLGLVACAPTPTATPTKSIIRVITTPAFESLVTHWAIEYMEAQDTARIDLQIFPLEGALDAAEGGMADVIVAGAHPPQGWFATPLSLEGIAVVVHLSNSIRSLNLEDLAALFNGEIDSWADLGGDDLPIQAIIPLPSDETREFVNSRVLEGSGFSPDAFIAPSPIAMLAMVTEDEGAIGFIPLSQASDVVRVVRVDGILPQTVTVGDGRYPLHLEILALAPEQPEGATHEWLAWIQAFLSTDSP